MLYGLILVVHVFVSLVLIAVILLQAGRGGGVSDAFGGTAQSMFGTRGAQVLTRATSVCAVIFMLTSLSLAVLSSQRSRSLLEGKRPPAAATQPAAPAPEAPAVPAPAQPEAAKQADQPKPAQ